MLCQNRFVPSSANGNKPPVSFQEKMTKVKAPTLDNLFDVETSSAMHDKQVKKVNRQVLQRFVMAYQAGRPVDLVTSAKHEVLSIPIAIFNTDRSRRQGQKSPLVTSILKFCGITETAEITETSETNIQHIIDCMAYIHTLKLNPKIKTFGDIGTNVSDHMKRTLRYMS